MPLWSRRQQPPPPDDDPAPEQTTPTPVVEDTTPPPIVGERACSRLECPATNAAGCQYIDRRGRRCDTAWCPSHQAVVHGRAYCTRHGGVVRAVLAGGLGTGPLPDLDNRAPSLVQFVGEAVSERMAEAIHEAWPEDLQLGVSPVKLSYLGPERRRSWSRKWTIYSHRGNEVAVTLVVAEDRDDVVLVRVDSDTVAELVPPWITHRSTAGDPTVREAFYAAIVDAARTAVSEAHTREVTVRENQAKAWLSDADAD